MLACSLQRKNVINKFIDAILKENEYCKKKYFYKNLVMSAEDERSFNSSNKCWIYNKFFAAGDNKLRDHDHVTGKYRVLLNVIVILTLNRLKIFM